MTRSSSPICLMPSRRSSSPTAAGASVPRSCTPKAYDIPRCRLTLRRRRIICRIARKGIDSSGRLGQHRWVVERTLAWLNRFRRLTVRYERRADLHQAFLTLGCALLCFNTLQKRF